MTPLYIIPARGGSKGIPRKNIKPLAGRPLIAYTLDVAKECRALYGGYILVSTDDEEIARAARSEGVEVDYMRPASLGADTTGSREVMTDAMDWAEARGISYDCVVLLQPTSPLRTVADVEAAIKAFEGHPGADMAVTVCLSDDNPYYNLFETDAGGALRICKGDGLLTRRQDAPPVYRFNGAVYVIRPRSLRSMPLGAFPVRVPVVMPAARSLDLDTLADWARLESMMLKK